MNLLQLARESVYKIDTAETESSMYYQYGKAMAFTELLYLRDHRYRDYMQMLDEVTNVVNSRITRGFPLQPANLPENKAL